MGENEEKEIVQALWAAGSTLVFILSVMGAIQDCKQRKV
jgi:hypothetical protein